MSLRETTGHHFLEGMPKKQIVDTITDYIPRLMQCYLFTEIIAYIITTELIFYSCVGDSFNAHQFSSYPTLIESEEMI